MIMSITLFVMLIVLLTSLYVKIQSLKFIGTNSPRDYRRFLAYSYILDNLLIVFAVFIGLYATFSYNILYIVTAMVGSIMITISVIDDIKHFKKKTSQSDEHLLPYDMAKLISITLFISLIAISTLFKIA